MDESHLAIYRVVVDWREFTIFTIGRETQPPYTKSIGAYVLSRDDQQRRGDAYLYGALFPESDGIENDQ